MPTATSPTTTAPATATPAIVGMSYPCPDPTVTPPRLTCTPACDAAAPTDADWLADGGTEGVPLPLRVLRGELVRLWLGVAA